MKKEISLELLNKIAQYLGTRPYVEVAQLIAEIMKEVDKNSTNGEN